MSRKRKPVLQLGQSTSKLHKYGYSKEFHAKDVKAKTALSTLVGSYSDSDGEDSAEDGEEHTATTLEQTLPGIQGTGAASDESKTPEHPARSPDMDYELKNFLSEIEAIPMPTDDPTVQEKKPEPEEHDSTMGSNSATTDVPKTESQESVHGASADSSQPTSRPASKSRYSMFVKGESEFVNSPPSQATETSTAKPEAPEASAEFEIPEEPISAWQLVQDEGSQYYYYWNTLTNEVTWEIPSEYTQFLLLHKEFSDKLARLPPRVLKAYQDRKEREAAAALAAVSATTSSSSKTQTQLSTVYGPAAGASPSPADTDFPSSSHRRKHKKEKKKRRHKHRQGGSDGESSDASGPGDSGKRVEFGPQLPEASLNSGTAPASAATAEAGDTSSASVAGPQLLSIVPYLSDADDDEEEEEEEEKEKDGDKESEKLKALGSVSSPVGKDPSTSKEASSDSDEDSIKGKSGSKSVPVEDRKKMDVEGGMPDDRELKGVKDKNEGEGVELGPAEQESSLNGHVDGEDTGSSAVEPARKESQKKSKKTKKEVIDMFAEDFAVQGPVKEEEVKSPVFGLREVATEHIEEKETADSEEKQERDEKSMLQDPTKDELTGTSGSSKELASAHLTKASSVGVEEKTKGLKDSEKPLVNIVGYGSEDETDQKTEENSVVVKSQKEKKAEQLSVAPSTLSSPVAPKKRKKEKKRHRLEEKGEKTDETLSNIVNSGLGRDIMARVSNTLDQEILDIVSHTPSSREAASKLTGDVEMLPAPQAGSDSLAPKVKKEKKPKRSKEDASKRLKVDGDLTSEKLAMLVAEQEKLEDKSKKVEPLPVKVEETQSDVKAGGDDDDDDIDFEDLDDLDRALEVALEKKKVELAKYEEGEQKQKEALAFTTQVSAAAEADAKAEAEEEEALKADVKDAADLALSKLEFLDISTDNLSRLQVLFVELQTRLHDWSQGGLSTRYFHEALVVAQGLLEQYELSAVPQGWACQWDRGNNRYYYRNLSTNRIQWDYPDDDAGSGKEQGGRLAGEEGAEPKGDRGDKKTSASKSERKHDRAAENGDHREAGRKKGSSSRHRKRGDKEERDRDRGGKHDKRRDSSGSSHRYRRKRRRRRDPSSSSDSSDDNDDHTTTAAASNISTSRSGKRRHHHKTSKKKKKRRSEQRSRSPSVEIVDEERGSSKEVEDLDKASPVVTVLDPSPDESSAASTPIHDSDLPKTASSSSAQPPPLDPEVESIDGEPLSKSSDTAADVDGVALDDDGEVGHSRLEPGEVRSGEGEAGEEDKKADREEEDGKKSPTETVNPAVIYRPPQIVVPPQVVAAARQPELYTAPQVYAAPQTLQATTGQAFQAAATTSSAQLATKQDQSEAAQEMTEEAEKQAKKKKKDKKLATGPSLMMKKKHMSSMVQKWQKVKKEVEKEDRAKEMRQAAIRKKIEELKQ